MPVADEDADNRLIEMTDSAVFVVLPNLAYHRNCCKTCSHKQLVHYN
jgi:hypothetical protein